MVVFGMRMRASHVVGMVDYPETYVREESTLGGDIYTNISRRLLGSRRFSLTTQVVSLNG